MFKKALAAAAVVAALVFVGAAGASAEDEYPPIEPGCSAAPSPITPGQTSVVTCNFPDFAGWDATLTVTGPGVTDATLSSLALTPATGTDTVTKPISSEGVVTFNFLGPAVTASTNFTVEATATDGKFTQEGSATITVNPAAGPTPGLPVTGGTVPAAVIWLGVGAIGIGGIAVAAAIARRRAAGNR